MKVLLLNRRDIANPAGGGAEVYTHELVKGLVARGVAVTVVSSRFAGAAEREDIDGITHIRKGNELTVHFWGFRYAFAHRREFDLIVDEYNGIGFFTFLLPRSSKRMMLIHQMYREFWFRELGFVGAVPYIMEPVLLRRYRRMPVVTVSESTKGDLKALGFQSVDIVMNALDIKPLEDVPIKEERPTLLFLGRLRSTKRPEDALRIFQNVKSAIPDAQLRFAGRGPQEERLHREARQMSDVLFHGYVDEERKLELLRRAHILLVPGVREGFGINVIEAAAMGTPAVGYNVQGLRDSIQDGYTGFLADGPEDAAQKVIRLLRDPELYAKMSSRCIEYSSQFNWQNRVEEFWRLILLLTGNSQA